MNNAIQDINISARELVIRGRLITEKQNLEKLLLAGEFEVEL